MTMIILSKLHLTSISITIRVSSYQLPCRPKAETLTPGNRASRWRNRAGAESPASCRPSSAPLASPSRSRPDLSRVKQKQAWILVPLLRLRNYGYSLCVAASVWFVGGLYSIAVPLREASSWHSNMLTSTIDVISKIGAGQPCSHVGRNSAAHTFFTPAHDVGSNTCMHLSCIGAILVQG